MISANISRTIWSSLASGLLCVAFCLPSTAQVQTSKTETESEPTKEVKIERGEIVYINGNSAVIKMQDGTLRHFDHVPDSVKFIVDGKPVNIHDAKVGMKLEKQTIITTTPKVITTVESVTGTVWHVQPPDAVILTLENGQNQQFKIPEGQKFTIEGRETDAWGLKKGMKISVQRVTEVPETVVAQQIKRTGIEPRAPAPPKEDMPILIALSPTFGPPIATADPEPPPTKLPKTASSLPLIGLLGMFFCILSLMIMAIRVLVAQTTIRFRS